MKAITETDIVMHAMHSGDFYPHHTDAEFAKKGPFGQRIAQPQLPPRRSHPSAEGHCALKGCLLGRR